MSYNITNLQNISSNIYKPFAITSDSLDNIYLLQSFYRRIVKVDNYGNIIYEIGASS